MAMPERYKTLDILKALAAILVLLGHAFQFSEVIETNRVLEEVYLIIYSFHMPLFSMISGFLLYKSIIRKGWIHALKGKLLILIPMIIFSLPVFFTRFVYEKTDGIIMNLRHFLGFVIIGNGLIWFLAAILISSFLLILLSWFKFGDILIVVGIILTFFLYRDYGLALISYIYTFDSIGFLVAKYCDLDLLNKYIYSVSGLVFISLLFIYRKEHMIYNGVWGCFGAENAWKIISVNLLRIAIGLSGCITVYGVIDVIKSKKMFDGFFVTYLSRNTLGIYCISNLVIEYLNSVLVYLSAYLRFALLLFASSLISFTLCLIFDKNKYCSVVFLGHL